MILTMKILAMEFMTTFCTGLFAGAALYISLVEHPARMECGTALAATEFGPSYRRATVMQVSLAIAAFLAAMVSFTFASNYAWLLGGLCIVAVIPFTLIVILPTNKKLLDPSLNRNSEAARHGRYCISLRPVILEAAESLAKPRTPNEGPMHSPHLDGAHSEPFLL
jgi:hypothetical protein